MQLTSHPLLQKKASVQLEGTKRGKILGFIVFR